MKKIIDFIKQHIIIAFSIVVIIVLSIILIVMLNDKVATVYIEVIPSDATVNISDQLLLNNTAYTFEPGHYTAVISKDGFKEQTVDLTLEPDQTSLLKVYLKDEDTTDNGFSYYKTNLKDLSSLREYQLSHPEDEDLQSFIEKYDHAQTIQSMLPLFYRDESTNGYYSVYYSTDAKKCDAIFCLEFSATSIELFYEAINKIINAGYDINFYHIITVPPNNQQ